MLNQFKNILGHHLNENGRLIGVLYFTLIVSGLFVTGLYPLLSVVILALYIWSSKSNFTNLIYTRKGIFNSIFRGSLFGAWIFILDLLLKSIGEYYIFDNLSEDFIIHCDNMVFKKHYFITVLLSIVTITFLQFGYFFERFIVLFPSWSKLFPVVGITLTLSILSLPYGICSALSAFTVTLVAGIIYIFTRYNIGIVLSSLIFYNIYYFIVYYFGFQRILYYWMHNG